MIKCLIEGIIQIEWRDHRHIQRKWEKRIQEPRLKYDMHIIGTSWKPEKLD